MSPSARFSAARASHASRNVGRVRLLDLQIPTLFGQDVEDRGATQVERLPDDVEVLPSESANAPGVETDGPLRLLIASLSRRDLRACGQLRRFATSLRARPLGLRRGDLTLVAIEQGEHDHRAAGDVVEAAAHAFERARCADALLGKASVHAHIGAKQADVDAAFATCLIDPRVRQRHARLGLAHVWPCRHR